MLMVFEKLGWLETFAGFHCLLGLTKLQGQRFETFAGSDLRQRLKKFQRQEIRTFPGLSVLLTMAEHQTSNPLQGVA